MFRTLRAHLSYANVMSTIAVFVVLGGGAYAATKLPKNSVGTKQIKNGAVTKKKLAKGVSTAGPKGDTGAQGVKGDKGDKGDAGAKGADGANGTNGTNGQDGQTGPRGPSDLFTFSSDGPISATQPVAAYALNAGKYLVTGKADLTNTSNTAATITCSLLQSGQAAVDATSVIVPAANSNTGKTDVVVQGALTFIGSNFVVMNCANNASVEVRDVKLNAVQVESITVK
jgi:hypothetical protein